MSQPGKPGPGMPEDFSHCLPYRYAFGVNQNNPVEYDLAETFQFLELCDQAGGQDRESHRRFALLQSAHPAARRLSAFRRLPAARRPAGRRGPADQRRAPAQSASAEEPRAGRHRLQLPPGVSAARRAIRPAQRLGRHDRHRAAWCCPIRPSSRTQSSRGSSQPNPICRTFSDCTTAPRNGLVSGCYPLDRYYAAKPESQKLKEIKKSS